jgi:hypothetical protein
MDKTSYFFTAQCGICHPGGATTKFDRNGNVYFQNGLYGYGGGVASLPSEARLDGDYGFINPSTGVPTTANWQKNGVLEADCLMCHLGQFATAPGTANQHNGLSWPKRAGTLRGFSNAGIAAFDWAPTAGAGWASLTYGTVPAGQPPLATAVQIDYGLGLTAGTLVNQGGLLAIPLGKIGGAKDANCRGCHSTPDGKKAGRTLLPITDAHVAAAVACTRCHVNSTDGQHQIGKGDITIGSVRNDLDNTVRSCADCHLDGMDAAAPDPSPRHAAIPGFHFNFMKCQACHIRYLDDDQASSTQEIPDLVIEMTSNGTQNVSNYAAYLKTNPLDPTQDDPALAGRPYRWYPTVRWYKGKLTTVKPLWTAWFGEWIGGTGDGALIRPVPLRLVRKALTDLYPVGSPRLASLTLTPGTQVASGAPVLHKKAEIRAFLLAMRNAVDAANTDTGSNDIVVNPVMVRADKVYYLDASDEVEFFHSLVGESHDFAVNHNVAIPRDPAQPVVYPGPYGAGGCNDCHGPSSPFFFGKRLAEPAQYDFLDEAGTIPNPEAGHPEYVSQYEILGYTLARAEQLTGSTVPVLVDVDGAFGSVTFGLTGGTETFSCRASDGGCKVGFPGGSSVTFTAAPESGVSLAGWYGCTAGADPLVCEVTLPVVSSGIDNRGILVRATFTNPPPPPPPTVNALVVRTSGGLGTVAGGPIDCRANAGTCGVDVLPVGSTVDLTATAWIGYTFVGWTGCTSATGNACSVTVNEDTLVRADFVPNAYPISVRIEGAPGSVTGSGFNCQSNTLTCLVNAAPGTVLTLNAFGVSGSTFSSWTACPAPSGATCTVTVDGALFVRANFSP